MISSINPSTGEVLAEYEEYSDQKINECIEKAELAYHSYQKTSLNKKISLMLNAASI
ncbi:MAG: aldehyde dehydrogenase family protein, partial [Ignavibacteria bacterium]|nr:aldehyde dehydrogenase family protein [Ignavibacteria bacterium]